MLPEVGEQYSHERVAASYDKPVSAPASNWPQPKPSQNSATASYTQCRVRNSVRQHVDRLTFFTL
jgi:hypothetical protein